MIRRRFNISKKQSANTIINYSTTDGQLISLPVNSISSFGVLLKSHYYGEIKFYGNVTKLGDAVFSGLMNLTSITIPESVTSIEHSAFWGCTSLTSINIPDSVTGIGENAFVNCESLASVTIGDSVTTIGDRALMNCTSLERVYCKSTTPPTLGKYVFYYNASGRKIYVPYQSLDAYKNSEYWSIYADYIVGYDFENDTIV